jgi:type IV pilus assembly protein PilA
MRRLDQKGFTLMELMVVIVIVAILAAVAVPLYINYVKDAQRTEAKGAIGAVITAEQTYYQTNNGIYAATTFIKQPKTGDQGGLNCDLTESLGNWDIKVDLTAKGYTVTATGLGTTGGPPATMKVTYTYDRTTGTGTWGDETTVVSGGGGGPIPN